MTPPQRLQRNAGTCARRSGKCSATSSSLYSSPWHASHTYGAMNELDPRAPAKVVDGVELQHHRRRAAREPQASARPRGRARSSTHSRTPHELMRVMPSSVELDVAAQRGAQLREVGVLVDLAAQRDAQPLAVAPSTFQLNGSPAFKPRHGPTARSAASRAPSAPACPAPATAAPARPDPRCAPTSGSTITGRRTRAPMRPASARYGSARRRLPAVEPRAGGAVAEHRRLHLAHQVRRQPRRHFAERRIGHAVAHVEQLLQPACPSTRARTPRRPCAATPPARADAMSGALACAREELADLHLAVEQRVRQELGVAPRPSSPCSASCPAARRRAAPPSRTAPTSAPCRRPTSPSPAPRRARRARPGRRRR